MVGNHRQMVIGDDWMFYSDRSGVQSAIMGFRVPSHVVQDAAHLRQQFAFPRAFASFYGAVGYAPVVDVRLINGEGRLTMCPNKSLEPTAVGAVSSAIAVHAASRRWLSFFR